VPHLLSFLVIAVVVVVTPVRPLAVRLRGLREPRGHELRRPRVRSAFERLTGCVLIALGVRLATGRR
jgi:threonine/homoserine/homoserine lactone efflux protein